MGAASALPYSMVLVARGEVVHTQYMKRVIVFLAEGFEEVEAVTPIDFLRRAGIDVIVAGIDGTAIRGAHDIVIHADLELGRVDFLPDGVVIPGGPGCGNIAQSPAAMELIRKVNDAGGLIAAICAAPVVVLAPMGLLNDKTFTCFMGMEKQVSQGTFLPRAVQVDGNILTSRSAGTAAEFSEAIIHELMGPEAARELAERTWQHWVRFD